MTETATEAPENKGASVVANKHANSKRRPWGSYLQLVPASVYFLVLFVGPLLVLLAYSFFTVGPDFDVQPGFSLANYGEVISDPVFHAFFARTLRVAGIIAVIVVLVAFPFSYMINYVFARRKQMLYFLVLVSLFGGYLVRIYAWRNLLGRQGIINQSLLEFGIIQEPLTFLLNSQFAIVIASVNFFIPLGILPIFSAMQNVSPKLIEAARDLGSSRLHAAVKVVLPLTMRGVAAAFAFAFIAAAAEWVTPALLGGTGDQFVGNQIAFQFGGGLNWPLGAALAFSLVVAVVIILAVLLAAVRRLTR